MVDFYWLKQLQDGNSRPRVRCIWRGRLLVESWWLHGFGGWLDCFEYQALVRYTINSKLLMFDGDLRAI